MLFSSEVYQLKLPINLSISKTNTIRLFQIVLIIFICFYLILGFNTELFLTKLIPIPKELLDDFTYYEIALKKALDGNSPYDDRRIGSAYLYPPPALLIIESFSHIQSKNVKASIYITINMLLLASMVYGISKYYGYTIQNTWYWYILCFGFAPFLELLHIGQINMITMFGLFLLFFSGPNNFFSGFGLGLAIITKVSPVVFFGYLTANRKVKNYYFNNYCNIIIYITWYLAIWSSSFS